MKIRKETNNVKGDFQTRYEPIPDSIRKEELRNGYRMGYLIQDDIPDYKYFFSGDDAFIVNYHRDFYVEHQVITEEETRNYYHGEKIPQQEDYHIFYLSCLIHSGVWLSLRNNFPSDPGSWDTSHVGLVLVKKEGKKREKARGLAKALVDDWNHYLMGEFFIAVVEIYDKDKNPLTYSIHQSVLGWDSAIKYLGKQMNFRG